MRLHELKQTLNESYSVAEYREDCGDRPYDAITGFISLKGKGFTSLEGMPTQVKLGDCDISSNKLTSLEHSPTTVRSNFLCSHNRLTSLVGGPTDVGRDYLCESNMLTSLEGAPNRIDNFYCQHNFITSLKGAPAIVDGTFDLSFNDIAAFDCKLSMPNNSRLLLQNNELSSLKNIHRHILQVSHINFEGNPIESHVLGLLKIQGLKEVMLYVRKNGKLTVNVGRIINKHLQDGRDVMACQDELMDADLEEYAQL